MRKLLLTSAGFENPEIGKEFLKLAGKPASEIKIIFIPTASRTKGELFYVEKSRKELLSTGVNEKNIVTLNLDHKISYKEVRDFDVIYVCGGNPFYLLHRVRESGFEPVIRQFLEDEGVYVGASSGSIILGPNIGSSEIVTENDINLQELTGLNLVNVTIVPHANLKNPEEIESFRKKANYKILQLKDSQALLIQGDKTKLIGD